MKPAVSGDTFYLLCNVRDTWIATPLYRVLAVGKLHPVLCHTYMTQVLYVCFIPCIGLAN